MNSLPYEDLIETALKIDIPDLPSFCASNKKYNVCKDDYFWKRRAEQDFEFKLSDFVKLNKKKGFYGFSGSYIYKVLHKTSLKEAFETQDVNVATVLYFSKFNNLSVNDYFLKLISIGDHILIQELLQDPRLSPKKIQEDFEDTISMGIVRNIFIEPIIYDHIDTVEILLNDGRFDPSFRLESNLETIFRKEDISIDMVKLLLEDTRFENLVRNKIISIITSSPDFEIIKYILDYLNLEEINIIFVNTAIHNNHKKFSFLLDQGYLKDKYIKGMMNMIVHNDKPIILKIFFERYSISQELFNELFKLSLLNQKKGSYLFLKKQNYNKYYSRIMKIAEFIINENYSEFLDYSETHMNNLNKDEIEEFRILIQNMNMDQVDYTNVLNSIFIKNNSYRRIR